VEREKEEGLAGVPNVERGLTATTFPVYLLGTWTHKNTAPLAGVPAFTHDSDTLDWGSVSWMATPHV